MKAWIFGPFKELKQGDVETLHIGKGGPNFGEAVEVLPAAVHDAQQAAIAAAVAAAEKFIEENICEFTNNAFGEGPKKDAYEVLAQLRAVKGTE